MPVFKTPLKNISTTFYVLNVYFVYEEVFGVLVLSFPVKQKNAACTEMIVIADVWPANRFQCYASTLSDVTPQSIKAPCSLNHACALTHAARL